MPEQAETYFRLADGNLDAAVLLFFENGHMGISEEQQVRVQSSITEQQHTTTEPHITNPTAWSDDEDIVETLPAPSRQRYTDDTTRAPIAPRREILIGDDPGFGVFGSGSKF